MMNLDFFFKYYIINHLHLNKTININEKHSCKMLAMW